MTAKDVYDKINNYNTINPATNKSVHNEILHLYYDGAFTADYE